MTRWTACFVFVLMACGDDGSPTGDSGTDAKAPDATDPPDVASDAPTDTGALTDVCTPDSAFIDEFGREGSCVFVSTSGSDDTGDGTAAAPFATVGRGIEVAASTGAAGSTHVAVAAGEYNERIELANGVSVYGEFDPDTWERSDANETTLRSNETIDGQVDALIARRINLPTLLDGFTVQSLSSEEGAGSNVVGIRVVDSTPSGDDGLVLRNLVVRAGDGTAGANGTLGEDGDAGADGNEGEPGDRENGDTTPGGTGGVAVCGILTVEETRGGTGGAGGGDGAMGCGTFRNNVDRSVRTLSA